MVVQAGLAGGFLAGRQPLRGLHEHLGYGLLAAGIALLAIGLFGRRSAVTVQLPTRVGLAVALAVTVFAGMRAGRGSSDLLMLHIPLAFAIAALAARLLVTARIDRRGLRRSGRRRRDGSHTPAEGHTRDR